MLQRVISGAFLAVIIVALLWVGGPVLAGVLTVVSIIGYMELSKATGVCDKDKKFSVLQGVSIIGILAHYGLLYFMCDKYKFMSMFMVIIFVFIAHMFVYVVGYPKFHASQVMHSCFSFVYSAVMLSFIVIIRSYSSSMDTDSKIIGFYAAWLIFIASWISDTFAYFAGVLLGKHKAFPVLSPKKTIEGCLGGVIGAGLAGFLYALALVKAGVFGSEIYIPFALLGLLGSVFSQIGDLAASAIKRNYEIKDYGKLIPGHGGIMDRFDSVIFVSPFIYALCIAFL